MRKFMKRYKGLTAILSCAVLLLITVLTALYSNGKLIKKGNGGCTGSCAGCGICKNPKEIASDYYLKQEANLLKTLASYQKVFKSEMLKTKSEAEVKEMTEETEKAFIELIPRIPYIGGAENRFTEDIETGAMVLAFFRVAEEHGMTADQAGELVINSVRAEASGYPKPLRRLMGGKYFTRSYRAGLKKDAERSKEKEYEGDWVYDYIEGDNQAFDYGYNFTECGLVKFFQTQGAEEYVPYLCQLDYVYSDAMEEGLTRTCTLASGGNYCDFRYRRVKNGKMDLMIYGAGGLILLGIVSGLIGLMLFLKRRRRRSNHKI